MLRYKSKTPSNPVETFKRIKRVIDEVGDKRIALDITGGKKTMIGGGFTAGSILGFGSSVDMFYVDSLEYNVNRGRPEWGLSSWVNLKILMMCTTYKPFSKLKNFLRNITMKQLQIYGKRLRRNLKHRSKVLKALAEQYSLKDEEKMVQSDLAMANCYKLWDAFDYQEAKKHKSFSFHIQMQNEHSLDHGGIMISTVHDSTDVLDILSKINNRKTTFEKESRVIHLAVDRYQSAMRRKCWVNLTMQSSVLCRHWDNMPLSTLPNCPDWRFIWQGLR